MVTEAFGGCLNNEKFRIFQLKRTIYEHLRLSIQLFINGAAVAEIGRQNQHTCYIAERPRNIKRTLLPIVTGNYAYSNDKIYGNPAGRQFRWHWIKTTNFDTEIS